MRGPRTGWHSYLNGPPARGRAGIRIAARERRCSRDALAWAQIKRGREMLAARAGLPLWLVAAFPWFCSVATCEAIKREWVGDATGFPFLHPRAARSAAPGPTASDTVRRRCVVGLGLFLLLQTHRIEFLAACACALWQQPA
jgi:hypothetical protein